jgi:hypothetical protein
MRMTKTKVAAVAAGLSLAALHVRLVAYAYRQGRHDSLVELREAILGRKGAA